MGDGYLWIGVLLSTGGGEKERRALNSAVASEINGVR